MGVEGTGFGVSKLQVGLGWIEPTDWGSQFSGFLDDESASLKTNETLEISVRRVGDGST
jgi:hypothetical protein